MANGGWRAHLALFFYFPGLICLALAVEKFVLEPRVAVRSPAQDASFWSRYVQQDAEFAPSYLRLGLARNGAGDLQGARQAYERALALDPEFEAAALGLNGVVRMLEGPAASIAQLDGFYRAQPRCQACPQNLAADHLALNHPAEARRYIDELLDRPGYQLSSVYGRRDHRLDALVLAGRIYEANGLHGQAQGFFEQALLRNPRDRAANFQLGLLKLGGDPVAAVAHWQRYRSLAPGDLRGRIYLARAHLAANQVQEARRELRDAQGALAGAPPAVAARWKPDVDALLAEVATEAARGTRAP